MRSDSKDMYNVRIVFNLLFILKKNHGFHKNIKQHSHFINTDNNKYFMNSKSAC